MCVCCAVRAVMSSLSLPSIHRLSVHRDRDTKKAASLTVCTVPAARLSVSPSVSVCVCGRPGHASVWERETWTGAEPGQMQVQIENQPRGSVITHQKSLNFKIKLMVRDPSSSSP